MRKINEITINKAAICVLEENSFAVTLPDECMTLTEQNYAYMEKSLLKIFESEDSYPGKFSGIGMAQEIIQEMFVPEEFINGSRKLAGLLAKAIMNQEKEPCGDLLTIEFECEKGKYIALLKVDHKDGFKNTISHDDDCTQISIENGPVGFAASIKRAAVIGYNGDVFVHDKDIHSWFVVSLLHIKAGLDPMNNCKRIIKGTEVFARKAFSEDIAGGEQFRRRVKERLLINDQFDITSTAFALIKDVEMRELFTHTMQNNLNTDDDIVDIDKDFARKKVSRTKFVIDKKHEINIDLADRGNSETFEIVTHPLGSVDIIIKNVNLIVEKI